MDSTNEAKQSGGIKRYLWIALPILLLIGVGLFLYWPRLELGFTINALNSQSAATFRDSRSRLVDAPREPWVDAQLRGALEDTSRSFKLRTTLAGVLIDRGQVPFLERIYLEGGVDTRGPILRRIQGESYFTTTYVNDPRWEVEETVRKWVGRRGDRTRWNALQLVRRLDMRDLIPELRAMLAAEDDVAADPRKVRSQRIGAMRVLANFQDCNSVDTIVGIVRQDDDPRVRTAALDALELLVMTENAPCGDRVDEPALKELTAGMLESDQREVAIKALMHLEKNPVRAGTHMERLKAMVQPGAGDRDGILRRHALLALTATGDDAFLDTLPLYFHDDNTFVRSSAAQQAGPLTKGPRLESCLIGMLERETDYYQGWYAAFMSLRMKAGRHVGLPAPHVKEAREDRATFLNTTLPKLFEGQAFHGADRSALVDAYFAWFAGQLGLDEDATTKAAEARAAFWKLADADKLDEATAALEAYGSAPAGLFAFEESYLASR